MSFNLPSDYNDVSGRIADFRTKHPEGSLQQVALEFREVDSRWWVVYTAAAYRTPDDARPGIGTAWEPVPGKTPYTKDSELQNAETAAWGRAIVAALAADTKKGIASAEEIRNRQDEETYVPPVPAKRADIQKLRDAQGELTSEQAAEFIRAWREHRFPVVDDLSADQAAMALAMLEAVTEVKQETLL